MSNQAVGGVYQTIIEEVINSSRVDFEESGVEESVLEELRKVSDRFFLLFVFSIPCAAVGNGSKQSSTKRPISVGKTGGCLLIHPLRIA